MGVWRSITKGVLCWRRELTLPFQTMTAFPDQAELQLLLTTVKRRMPDVRQVNFLSWLVPQRKPLTPCSSPGLELYLWYWSEHAGFYASPDRGGCCCPQPEKAQQVEHLDPESNLMLLLFPELLDPASLSSTHHSYCQCTSSSDYLHSADLQHVGKVGDDLMVSNRDHISRTNAVTLLHWVLYRVKP